MCRPDQGHVWAPFGSNVRIRTANGSLSSIVGKGSVSITPTMPLSSILHVTNFALNLLSVSHLTKSLNSRVNFFPSVFQGIETKRIIGRGHENHELHSLDNAPHTATSVHQLPSSDLDPIATQRARLY